LLCSRNSRDGFLAGVEASLDAATQQPKGYAAALGYSAPQYAVQLKALNALSAYQAGYYHKVTNDLEAGAVATYKQGTQGVALEVGVKSYLDAAAFISACSPSHFSRMAPRADVFSLPADAQRPRSTATVSSRSATPRPSAQA
jgi:hypothetical protein